MNIMSNHTCSDRPLRTCKACIVVTATIFTLFKANTKEATKEVARPSLALNKVNVVAVTNILGAHVGNGLSEHV